MTIFERKNGGIDMAYIHTDDFLELCYVAFAGQDKKFINTVEAVVESTPTVDLAEVVHCKNCKYLMFSDFYGECSKGYMGIVSPDDYCSRGERKE